MALVASLYLALGIVLLVAGALAVVEAASALARRMGISPMWIGLTVVAIGTSAPELTVSSLAAWRGNSAIALGNVVGSNTLNILIVLGITALAIPVTVQRLTVCRDIALVVIVGLVVWALAADGILHWAEGTILLIAAVPYMRHVYKEEKRGWMPVVEPPQRLDGSPAWVQWAIAVLGLALLAFGAQRLVVGSVELASVLGISERVIGLTIVAMGTSAPELATSLIALHRKKPDLALGNIIGSNILNLLLVLGTAAMVRSIPVERSIILVDLPFMVFASLLLVWFGSTRGRITRVEGALLLGAYLLYVGLLIGGVLEL